MVNLHVPIVMALVNAEIVKALDIFGFKIK